MKKPRISFDKDAVVAFLFNHCEKFVVGLVGLIGLGLAWNGINALRLKSVRSEQTPQAISQLTSQTVGHIDASTKPPAELTRRENDLVSAIDPWRPQQVKVAPPPELALFDRPIVEQLARRSKPEVLPVEDLRAIAGVAVLPDPIDPAAMVPPAGRGAAAERPLDGEGAPGPGPRGRPRRGPARGEEPLPEQPPVGEFGIGGMPPGERTKVVPYVVLTGLVPVEKQREEYGRAFGSAGFRDPQLDMPRWSQYLVERSVVGAAGSAPKWERLKIKNVEVFGQGGMASVPPNQAPEPMQQEMLPPTFLLGSNETDIGYVASLPQRVDEPWGFETVHPWFRPQLKKLLETASGLSSDTPAVPIDPKRLKQSAEEFDGQLCELAGMQLVGEPQRGGDVVAFGAKSADGGVSFPIETAAADQPVFVMSSAWARTLALDDGPRRDTTCTLRVRIAQLGQTPVAHILGITYPGANGEPGEELLDPAPFPLGGAGGGMGGEFGAGRFVDGAGGGLSDGEEFRLFRFLDTTVKPGLRYRYRVRIALLNPNFGLPQQHLADPTSAKGEYILSKDSNETSPIAVPDATTLLVRTLTKDEIKQQKMKKDSLQVLLLAPAKETGNYSLRSLITDVGGLANVDESLNKPGDTRTKGERAITDRVLVDVRGRQEEAGKPGFPSETLEMLFLRPDGSFDFVSAADSQRLCDRYRATLDPPVDQAVPMSPEGLSPFESTPPRRGPDR